MVHISKRRNVLDSDSAITDLLHIEVVGVYVIEHVADTVGDMTAITDILFVTIDPTSLSCYSPRTWSAYSDRSIRERRPTPLLFQIAITKNTSSRVWDSCVVEVGITGCILGGRWSHICVDSWRCRNHTSSSCWHRNLTIHQLSDCPVVEVYVWLARGGASDANYIWSPTGLDISLQRNHLIVIGNISSSC